MKISFVPHIQWEAKIILAVAQLEIYCGMAWALNLSPKEKNIAKNSREVRKIICIFSIF